MGKSASSYLLQRRAPTLIMKIWIHRTYYVLCPVPLTDNDDDDDVYTEGGT